MEWLKGKKTYIIVVLGVITLLTNLLTGDISIMEFLSSDSFIRLLELLGLGTLRAGVKSVK